MGCAFAVKHRYLRAVGGGGVEHGGEWALKLGVSIAASYITQRLVLL